MAWSPISLYLLPLINTTTMQPYSGAVLKAEAAGTTTAIQFATDSTGNTLVDEVDINSAGWPEVSGNIVIPHINQDYKLILYPTQAAADSGTGAIYTLDNLTPTGISADQVVTVTTLPNLRNYSGSATTIILEGAAGSGDGEAGIYRYNSGSPAGTYTDNGTTIIVPTGGDGSAAWLILPLANHGLDAELAALAGLTSAADRLAYFTGSGTASLTVFTGKARDLLDDVDASTMRTTLGLGTMSTQNANAVAITGGAYDGGTIGASTAVTEFHCDSTSIDGSNIIISDDVPALILKDSSDTGSGIIGYVLYRDSADSTKGLIGFDTSANTDFTIQNNLGDIEVDPSTGIFKITGTANDTSNNAYVRITQADGTLLGALGVTSVATNDVWLQSSVADLRLISAGSVYVGSSGTDRVLTTADEGSGNGLDADTLDGFERSQLLRSDADDSMSGVLTMSSSHPRIRYAETDAAVDNRNWEIEVQGEEFKIKAGADDYGTTANFIEVNRTDASIDTVNFPNGTLQYGGAEVVSINNAVSLYNKAYEGGTIGATTPVTSLSVDNITIDANTIFSTNTNGNLDISTDGTGQLRLYNATPVVALVDTNSTGASINSIISYRDSGSTQRAYCGYGSGSNTDWSIQNSLGDIDFAPSASGICKITGTTTGNANLAYLRFNQSDATLDGYVGISSSSNRALEIKCVASNIDLNTPVGAVYVNGSTVCVNSTTATHTCQQIELGHATNTTLTSPAAGRMQIEGSEVAHGTPTNNNFLVGNGTTWAEESGATVRASLGVTIGVDVPAYDAIQTKIKDGTEIVTSSATLQDDDDLVSFEVEANTRYIVEASISYWGAGGGIKIAFISSQTNQSATGSYTFVNDTETDYSAATTALFTTTSVGFNQGGGNITVVGSVLTHATNSGTIKFQWAQNVSSGTGTSVYAPTMMRVTKVWTNPE